jgi:hypothetical protein
VRRFLSKFTASVFGPDSEEVSEFASNIFGVGRGARLFELVSEEASDFASNIFGVGRGARPAPNALRMAVFGPRSVVVERLSLSSLLTLLLSLGLSPETLSLTVLPDIDI